MHGVWREGSLGIGVGTPSKSLSYEFAPDAWARYDAYAKQAVEKTKYPTMGDVKETGISLAMSLVALVSPRGVVTRVKGRRVGVHCSARANVRTHQPLTVQPLPNEGPMLTRAMHCT